MFERLYQEKDKYFDRKSRINNAKLDEEMKNCTFKPRPFSPKNNAEKINFSVNHRSLD